MNPVVTVRRHLSTLTFDWTTNGACIDVTPNGGALSNADKGIVYRDCLPVRNADFNVWKIYQLKIQDPGGSDVCFGAVKVLPIAALYSAPSIHYIIPSDDKSHVANHPEFGDISIESVLPTVGISDLRIYPNPGTEVIQLSFDAQSEEDLTVFITDIAGRILCPRCPTGFPLP